MKGKVIPTGENIPDYPWLIRWAMHYLMGLAFALVPVRWMDSAPSRRYRIWSSVTTAYGWWTDSYRVDLRQEWPK